MPISNSIYKCDSIFHTDFLKKMTVTHNIYGFIIVDGNGALFGTLQGNIKTVLENFTVDLPRKHGRGGQSQNRFERIRTEKRHNYLREVCEAATDHFITNDLPNVKSLIIAGSAELKFEIMKSDLFDKRLQNINPQLIDISYGGLQGFNQAIEDSAEILKGVKYLEEKKIIQRFFDEIARDTGKYVFGIKDTIEQMLNGVIDMLIINEDFDHYRLLLEDSEGNQQVEFISSSELLKNNSSTKYIDQFCQGFIILEKILLTEWLLDNHQYKKYVRSLEIVSGCSPEGAQFLKGFGGIGGILRYKVQQEVYDMQYEAEDTTDFI